MKGIDAAFNCSAIAGKLSASGVGFVARYYGGSHKKDLTAAEAKVLCDAGLRIVTVFEALGDRFSSFHAPAGHRDAITALNQARAAGQPEGSCIFFAVDFDASETEVGAGVVPYFQSVGAVLHGRYHVGVYGSGGVLGHLAAAVLADRLWLAQSRGWRGTAGFEAAHIIQGPSRVMFGVNVDTDKSASDDFGSWRLGEHPAAPVVPVTVSRDDMIAGIKALQYLLAGVGFYDGAIDGIAGPQTIAALQRFHDDG